MAVNASFIKFNQFVEDRNHKVHNLGSDQLTIALSNTAPDAADEVLADITEISYTNCSSRNVVTASSGQTSGTYRLFLNTLVLTAAGGSVGPFRHLVLYNNTPTSPADPLIGRFDYGSEITLADGQTLTITFDGVNGALVDA
jgi:hypothetical protein